MVAYYISYGEPPRRFRWWLVAVLGVAGLLGVGAAVGVWQYRAGDDDEARAEAPPAATFADAVADAFAPGADTMYLVDISGSIEASGHLRAVRQALSALALEAPGQAGAAVASGSRAALLTFGGESREPKRVVGFTPLRDTEAQNRWLVQVNDITPPETGGSFIYDAIDEAYQRMRMQPDGDADAGRDKVLVILSDGIDGGVGECRPARPGETAGTGLCVGAGGDPLPCDDLPGMQDGSPRRICDGIYSIAHPDQLLAQLAESSVTVHTIGYGRRDRHEWLMLAAAATGGKYQYAGRQ